LIDFYRYLSIFVDFYSITFDVLLNTKKKGTLIIIFLQFTSLSFVNLRSFGSIVSCSGKASRNVLNALSAIDLKGFIAFERIVGHLAEADARQDLVGESDPILGQKAHLRVVLVKELLKDFVHVMWIRRCEIAARVFFNELGAQLLVNVAWQTVRVRCRCIERFQIVFLLFELKYQLLNDRLCQAHLFNLELLNR